MAVTVDEYFRSRRFGTGQFRGIELIYVARGSDDEAEISAAVLAEAPTTYDGMVRLGIRDCEPETVTEAGTGTGDGIWIATVAYGPDSGFLAVGATRFRFNTSGGTQHFQYSRATKAVYTPSTTVTGAGANAEFENAIGVDAEGNIAGADVIVPIYEYEIDKAVASGDVDDAFKANVIALTGTVNDGTYLGLDAGENLFFGASGSERGDGITEITYRFAGAANRTNFNVGGITIASADGWDLVWTRYIDKVDSGGTFLGKELTHVVVDQVYLEGDHDALDI